MSKCSEHQAGPGSESGTVTVGQVRGPGIRAGVSDGQGGYATTQGSATARVLVNIERHVCVCAHTCVLSLANLSPDSRRGEGAFAVGTCVSPIRRCC